ncbi:hypothetical protein HG535_0F04550 [Zygotorulaspora mrakii]|uniref:DASH complex subunit SPC19 n=1 Tax=Zygotorulaspora mrakii TaxID=42260 RepID=A0A7H9B614_ZYGMR|nr:uncharacterized protein HG535_0F04550 [Zygotorulaspora mrakii]QLG73943.1 hypothetical protein HG535_0F04550 [Zygotorulaspora mrakii]
MTDSLQRSMACLEDTITILENSVSKLASNSKPNDYLTQTMLSSRRVFELVPEYDVQEAKLDLIEEVEPLVKTLEDKLEKSVVKMKRELDTLRQTYELNRLRLDKTLNSKTDIDVSTDVVIMASSTNEELEELKMLKAKKENLQRKLQLLREKHPK